MTSPSRNNLEKRKSTYNYHRTSHHRDVGKTVSKTSNQSKKYNRFEKVEISPRQEIYKSMLREIRSIEEPQMNSLVHKASGILRLNHYKKLSKNQKVLVSWDADGRKVLTYEGKGGVSRTALQRETNYERSSKKSLLESLNQPIYGLNFKNFKLLSQDYDPNINKSQNQNRGAADCERRTTPVSKLWEDYIDTGDSTKLWDSKESIIPRHLRSRHHHHRHRHSNSRVSNSSFTSGSTRTSVSIGPPLGNRSHHKSNVKPSRDRIKSWESTKTLWGSPKLINGSKTDTTSQGDLRKSKSRHSPDSRRKESEEKVDRVLHICVVNGSVVTFKDFGFENFTNWFGDESVLEANQQRSQPNFHLELDLARVENKDIKIRYLDGYKLEIEAKRKIEGSKKPLRMKECLYIPHGYRAEDLLLCRTKAGKIVVEDLTSEPLEMLSLTSLTQTMEAKVSKSKNNVKPKERQPFRI